MRLDQIADKLACALEGDGAVEIAGVATLEDAGPNDLSFLANMKYFAEAKATKAAAIITGPDCPRLSVNMLRHPNPYLMFAKAIEIFHAPPQRRAFIHPTAYISDTASIGKEVSIGAYTYVGDGVTIEDYADISSHCSIHSSARIGEWTVIHSGCAIRERVSIGKRCIIQNNAVVGSDGLGFAKQDDGSWYKIIQAGTVVIEDDVEIGACTTIDRATLGETRIQAGTKVDNLVQVGHGSSVGRNSMLCAQVGLAGSTRVGNNVLLAGQVGAAGHQSIGDGAIVTAQAGVHGTIQPGSIISGSPGFDNKQWLKATAVFVRLPEVQRAVRSLERRVEKLESTFNVTVEEAATKI